MGQVELREPRATDVEVMPRLLDQLGHPSSAEQIRARLARMMDGTDSLVLVAERDGRVVGLAAADLTLQLERDPSCRLTALVVDETERRGGVGRVLTAAVEHWAREQGAFRVELTSAHERTVAHAFYESVGYREQSKRFVKVL
jgi:GNAT superfamily N-acetyltransferase